MDSEEAKVENGSTKSKLLDLLKKIFAVYLALVTSVFQKLEDFLELIHVSVHDKVDNYAPSPVKNLHDKFDSHSREAVKKTKSLFVGGIPVLGNVVGGITNSIANPKDVANKMIDRTTSLVMDNPVAQAVNSAAEKMMQEAQSAGKKAALKSVYASITLLLLPLIAELWYKANTKEWFSKLAEVILPLIEKFCKWYNDTVDKMEEKGYSFFGYLPTMPILEMETAYKLVKTKNDGIEALEDAGEVASGIVGNIPIVGGLAQTADQVMDNTASLVMDNPLTQAVESAADEMIENTEELATKAALKAVYAALTVLLCPAIAEVCYKLREFALIKALGKMILPLIEELCEWYNQKLKELDEKGYSFFGYLPTVPITEMKVAYKLVKMANGGLEVVGGGLEAVGGAVGLNDDDD
ncbi:hypothetical protein LXL04_020647 [Taraxacum kok-saghyz]